MTFAIVNGPSKEALIEAFRTGNKTINFIIILGYNKSPSAVNGAYRFLPISEYEITSIKDINDHTFVIEGKCRADFREEGKYLCYSFEAKYDAITQEGTINFPQVRGGVAVL